MTIQDLKEQNLIVLECISGSRAYGLATKDSDTDIKGVYILPKNDFYSLNRTEQVNNASNDEVYYELRKFMELLAKNNPNIIELLASPSDCIITKHTIMDKLKAEYFLSKECKNSFGSYAITQIKKAKGLKKKIVNPMDKERKSILDFCYVTFEQGSMEVMEFLKSKGYEQENCGFSKIPHMHDTYGLYYNIKANYKGIVKNKEVNDLSLSSIEKGETPIATLFFNKSGYSKYCKDYKEYWEWISKRNEARYKNTIEKDRNYDTKNMMHTFRLLKMAKEIGEFGEINVKRTDREFLLDIKNGKYQYEELMLMAEKLIKEVEDAFENSDLPDHIDTNKIDRLLVEIRDEYYNS